MNPPNQVLIVRYKNTLGDLIAFHFNSLIRSPVLMGILALMLAHFTYLNIETFFKLHPPVTAAVLVVIVDLFLLAVIGLLMLFAVTVILFSKWNKTILTEHLITLNETGLIEETKYNVSEFKWAGIGKLRKTRRYLYVFVAASMAHVIPRRAFESNDEFEAFYAYCEARKGREV